MCYDDVIISIECIALWTLLMHSASWCYLRVMMSYNIASSISYTHGTGALLEAKTWPISWYSSAHRYIYCITIAFRHQDRLMSEAKEGWEYAPLFNMKFHHKERKMDLVRRRRWHRKMVAETPNAPCFFQIQSSEVGHMGTTVTWSGHMPLLHGHSVVMVTCYCCMGVMWPWPRDLVARCGYALKKTIMQLETWIEFFWVFLY